LLLPALELPESPGAGGCLVVCAADWAEADCCAALPSWEGAVVLWGAEAACESALGFASASLAPAAEPLCLDRAASLASRLCTEGESLRLSAASAEENSSPPEAESAAEVFQAAEEPCGLFD